jgi:hypothetical protein
MDLALVSAVELLGLADEDVVPLAAQMADAAPWLTTDALVARVKTLHDDYQRRPTRPGLVSFIAQALVLLIAHPRTTALRQSPERTRPIVLSTEDFAAFRLGRLRAVTFRVELYEEPREGDVLRLLESGETGRTGRDALAEVLYVTQLGGLYVVSVRPWRGAGTTSFEAALLQDRRDALREVALGLKLLRASCASDTHMERVCEATLRTLDRAMTLTLTTQEAIAAE